MTSPGATGTPAISLRSVGKTYVEGMPILSGVDLDVRRGEIHALVGGNGSGKSTLVKLLSGYHMADAGSIVELGGVPVEGQADPDAVRRLGVRFVHQESVLVAGVSVLDNMAMGTYQTGAGWKIAWREEEAQLQALFRRWDLDIDPRTDVGSLPLATVARLGVLRALRRRPGDILNAVVLDEPTAALGREDATGVLQWLRQLAQEEHVGVLFISHRLDEILAVADRVSVLRGGRIADSRPVADFTEESLVEQIVGAKLAAYYPPRQTPVDAERALRVKNLAGGRVQDVSFDVGRGEILGITGIPGSGFEEVPYLLMDPARNARGDCSIGDTALELRRTSLRERGRRGLVLIPADRKRTALAADMTVSENMGLPRLGTFFRKGLLRRRAADEDTMALIQAFGVEPDEPHVTAGRLSGGNQQKAVLGKWLGSAPTVLMMHEPTQAVDVGARADIFRLIARCAKNGTATLLASVEYEDLAHLCDRVLVFGGGRISAELSGATLTPDHITAAAYLSSSQVAA